MNGKIIGIVILASAVMAGVFLYYLQIYGFYREVPAPGDTVMLVPREAGAPERLPVANKVAIDADSSPIRYRACFDVKADPEALAAEYETLDGLAPRNAPGWFDCFDAAAIGAALEAGEARLFLSEKNIHFGVDRVVAITRSGRGFVWHEPNECGKKAYDGSIVGEACPERPAE